MTPIDVFVVDLIHRYVSDRFIFDVELLWFASSVFCAAAPPKLTQKLPNSLMKILNIITLHWNNSKNSDVNGNRKW